MRHSDRTKDILILIGIVISCFILSFLAYGCNDNSNIAKPTINELLTNQKSSTYPYRLYIIWRDEQGWSNMNFNITTPFDWRYINDTLIIQSEYGETVLPDISETYMVTRIQILSNDE